MAAFSLPVRVSCSDAGLGLAGPQRDPCLSLTLSLNLHIPLPELLTSLMDLQKPSEPGPEASRPCRPSASQMFLMPEDPQLASKFDGRAVAASDDAGFTERNPEAVVQAQSPQLAAWEVLPLTPKQLECRVIRVSNLIRGLKVRELEEVFTSQVGPVEKVVVSEGFAQISFGAAKHAFAAVQKCDGSVLEVTERDERAGERSLSLTPIPWHSSGNALRQMFSDFLYALDECHYRRGDRWLTIAEVQKVKQGNNTVEFKGSIIKVVLYDGEMASELDEE